MKVTDIEVHEFWTPYEPWIHDSLQHYYGPQRRCVYVAHTDTGLTGLGEYHAPETDKIDRYIGNPGQALAYKVGQLRMMTIRQRAEIALGDDFDVRAFHDELLGAGALPLDLLEQRMDAWVAQQN